MLCKKEQHLLDLVIKLHSLAKKMYLLQEYIQNAINFNKTKIKTRVIDLERIKIGLLLIIFNKLQNYQDQALIYLLMISIKLVMA